MGRNRFIRCRICSKNIRSDNMKLHTHVKVQVSKYTMKICPTCNKTMVYSNLVRHMRTHANVSHSKLIDAIKADQEKNKEEFENGVFIKEYIKREKIDPAILRREHQKVLKANSHSPPFDVVLKTWQERILKLIKPSERDIVWIIGKSGNEGKSWFQRHLKNIYGSSRVFQANIKKNSDGILHALSKRIVSLIDLFLFNVPRSFNMNEFPYEMLEEIKDGNAVSTKYDSSIFALNIPNIVLVFSNEAPDKNKMSEDRWNVYSVGGEQLLTSNGHMVE